MNLPFKQYWKMIEWAPCFVGLNPFTARVFDGVL